MFKILKFLITGIGIPLIANQFRSFHNNDAPKISLAVLLASFLTKKRKQIIRISLTAILGTVLIGCGGAFLLYTFALRIDFQGMHSFQTSFIVSSVILLLGAGLDLYVWKKAVDIEKEFEVLVRGHLDTGQQSGSFFKNLISIVAKNLSSTDSLKAFQ